MHRVFADHLSGVEIHYGQDPAGTQKVLSKFEQVHSEIRFEGNIIKTKTEFIFRQHA